MKTLFFLCIVACSSMLLAAPGATAGPLSILSPPDKSSVENTLLSVIVKIDKNSIDDITISIDNKKQNLTKKPLNKYYACYEGIRVSPGMNSLKISGLKNGRIVEEIDRLVLLRTKLSSTSNSDHPEFTRYYFHNDDNEKKCVPCHLLDFSTAKENPRTPQQSPCFACHKMIMNNYAFVHGPAAVWSCIICHDPRSKGHKLGVLEPDEKSCVVCHENTWNMKKYMHGPTAAGNCTSCHNPHASDIPFFLRVTSGDLCVACHADTASRPHLISGFSGNDGHPVRKTPDPFNPSREFTCASCHNPHASDYSFSLRSDNSSTFQFCLSCHKM